MQMVDPNRSEVTGVYTSTSLLRGSGAVIDAEFIQIAAANSPILEPKVPWKPPHQMLAFTATLPLPVNRRAHLRKSHLVVAAARYALVRGECRK